MTPKLKKKYYTVWVGEEPGVYDSWSECQRQINGFPGARYKSFSTQEEAVEAFRGDPKKELDMMRAILLEADRRKSQAHAEPEKRTPSYKPVGISTKPVEIDGIRDYTSIPDIRLHAIAVDGACAGNPGRMEYRAVRVIDGQEVFHIGADRKYIGTNNIAEFLAIIHLAAILDRNGDTTTPIYTDSKNNFAWLRKGRSNTTLQENEATAPTLELLRRANAWLAAKGPIRNPILKWKTELWGEIPADFGRK